MTAWFSSGQLDVSDVTGWLLDSSCQIQFVGVPNTAWAEIGSWELRLAGRSVRVEWGGQSHTVQELLEIGQAAWTAWSQRGRET
jgi:hypothetical protein